MLNRQVKQQLGTLGLPLHAAVLLTMLRSPVDRVMSEHKYALSRPSKNLASLQFLQADDGKAHRALFSRLEANNLSLPEYGRS